MPSTVPTIKDRGDLLAYLRDEGYKGKAILADVETFITETLGGLELSDPRTNKNIELKDLWAKVKSARTGSEDGSEQVEIEDEPRAKAANGSGDGNAARVRAANAKAMSIDANGDRVFNIKKLGDTQRRKAYDQRASKGETIFADADTMEVFNAACRLQIAAVTPKANQFYTREQRDNDISICGKSTQTELINTLGGALFDQTFDHELKWATESYGMFRYLANNVRIVGSNTWFRRKTGIFSMSHIAQGTALTSSNNTYDLLQLTPGEIYGLIPATIQMFEQSSVSLQDDLARTFQEAYLKRCDQDYFLGDGTSTYGGNQGLISALPSAAYLATASSWSGVTAAHIINAMGTVENVDSTRMAWAMSRQAFYQIVVRLAMALGGNTATNFVSGYPNMGLLMGVPVYFVQVMPTATAATTTFAYYGDFQGASMFGTRMQLRIDTSEHAGFTSGLIYTRGIAEIAVDVHGDGRASTYGPVVGLKTT